MILGSMQQPDHILIVDDDKDIREQLDQTSRIVLIQPGTDLVEHIAALLG